MTSYLQKLMTLLRKILKKKKKLFPKIKRKECPQKFLKILTKNQIKIKDAKQKKKKNKETKRK